MVTYENALFVEKIMDLILGVTLKEVDPNMYAMK